MPHVTRQIEITTVENGYIVKIRNNDSAAQTQTLVCTDDNDLYDEVANWIAYEPRLRDPANFAPDSSTDEV